jgi:hypothetical protein
MLRTRVRAGTAAGLVLSLVFAALFTAVSMVDLYVPVFAPQMGEPTPVTLRVPYGPRIVQGTKVLGSHLAYEHARIIIPRGTVLHEADDDHSAAFAYESIRRPIGRGRIGGYAVAYFITCQMLMAYLRRFGQSRVQLLRPQVGLLVLMLASVALAKACCSSRPSPSSGCRWPRSPSGSRSPSIGAPPSSSTSASRSWRLRSCASISCSCGAPEPRHRGDALLLQAPPPAADARRRHLLRPLRRRGLCLPHRDLRGPRPPALGSHEGRELQHPRLPRRRPHRRPPRARPARSRPSA